ncbi:MAG: HD domain-containing protein [Gemmatimonadota bacterium]
MSHVTSSIAPSANSGALQRPGQQLLYGLYAALQSLKLFPVENATVQKALDELHRAAARIVEKEGVAELGLVGDFVFLNDVRLRQDLSSYAAYSLVSGSFARHGVGLVEVVEGVGREEWPAFLQLLTERNLEEVEDPFARFSNWLEQSTVRHINVGPERDKGELDEDQESPKEVAKRAYVQTVQVAHEVLTDMRLGRAVNVRRVKRAVQSIVDQVLNNETSIVGMTTLRDYDEYTFTHSVNVCIFSVVLGQKLGLDKLQLYELGLGALFHDIGKMRIDPEITNKPGALTDEEFEKMRQHPTEGLLALFSMHGFGLVPFRAMLMAYEHHMKTDLTGYPPNKRERDPTLFSRIVAVADGFDAATTSRSYHSPWRPEAALREMKDNPKRGLDPLLVKAMINVTGIFPVGQLVILDSYELAVVVAPNPDPKRLNQPVAKIIIDPMGMPLPEPVTVDLSEVDPATGKPRRSIIKTTDPDRYGIKVSDYFV